MALIIQEYVSLSDKNWFQTGGCARYFCEPQNAYEFQEALSFALTKKLSLFVLGQGANILVSDAGFDGLVIRPQINEFHIHEKTNSTTQLVTCGAGLTMNDLIEKTVEHHLIGLEVFSGIPGTLGGCTFINLHYFTHFLSHFVHSAQVIEQKTGTILTVNHEWFKFGYNQSTLMDRNYFLLSVTLSLSIATDLEVAYARGRRYEIIRHRNSRYPSSHTCGSFFRNFHDDEVSLISNNKKMIFVAFYLDKIGVKGVEQKGGARVSWQHANMLINTGNATSQDVVDLARTLQQKVYDQFSVLPQPECLFVGFKEYPLLTSNQLTLAKKNTESKLYNQS